MKATVQRTGEVGQGADDVASAGALPLEYSSFVGRRTQLAAARAALGRTRLLAVLEPGGLGKTRFARAADARLARLHFSVHRGHVDDDG